MFKVGFVVVVLAMAAVADEANELYERNKELRRDVAALRTEVNALADECVRLEKTAETLTLTAELMDGRRRTLPKLVEEIVETVAEFETDVERAIVVPEGGKRSVVHRWLGDKVRPGSKYRFECMMKAEDVKGCEHIKFGGFVGVTGGSTQWPSSSVGAGTFDWRKVSFDYLVPAGGRFTLLYGIESGYGKVWVKDVKVFRISTSDHSLIQAGY